MYLSPCFPEILIEFKTPSDSLRQRNDGGGGLVCLQMQMQSFCRKRKLMDLYLREREYLHGEKAPDLNRETSRCGYGNDPLVSFTTT